MILIPTPERPSNELEGVESLPDEYLDQTLLNPGVISRGGVLLQSSELTGGLGRNLLSAGVWSALAESGLSLSHDLIPVGVVILESIGPEEPEVEITEPVRTGPPTLTPMVPGIPIPAPRPEPESSAESTPSLSVDPDEALARILAEARDLEEQEAQEEGLAQSVEAVTEVSGEQRITPMEAMRRSLAEAEGSLEDSTEQSPEVQNKQREENERLREQLEKLERENRRLGRRSTLGGSPF